MTKLEYFEAISDMHLQFFLDLELKFRIRRIACILASYSRQLVENLPKLKRHYQAKWFICCSDHGVEAIFE